MASRMRTEISEPEKLSYLCILPFGLFGKDLEIVFSNIVGVVFNEVGQLCNPRPQIRQRNIYPPFKPPPHRRIQSPRQIGRPQHQNPLRLIPNTVHLHQKLCFDPPTRLILPFSPESPHRIPITRQRINLIDEDNTRLLVSGHLK